MAKRDDDACCTIQVMRTELKRRATRGRAAGRGRALSRAARGPFSAVPTAKLIRALRDSQRAIYGTDDRKDLYEVTRPELLRVADSVVALVEASDLSPAPRGRVRLATTRYRDDYQLCASEPFANQPLGCFCTGFLVAPDIVATAGHCVRSPGRLRKVRFVFGFRMLDKRRARTVFEADDVYEGAELLGRQEAETGADWALIRLARPVVGRAPLRVRTSGKLSNGGRLFVIGHPNGLPAKLAGRARVRANSRKTIFVANLDTYGGNSGSPVFDQGTRVVEGILVRGEDDFVDNDGCNVSLVCPDAECRGEDVTRSTVWSKRIPRS